MFNVSIRINGKVNRIKIGAYPILSLGDAREKARTILRDFELGIETSSADEIERSPTLGEVVPLFIELSQ